MESNSEMPEKINLNTVAVFERFLLLTKNELAKYKLSSELQDIIKKSENEPIANKLQNFLNSLKLYVYTDEMIAKRDKETECVNDYVRIAGFAQEEQAKELGKKTFFRLINVVKTELSTLINSSALPNVVLTILTEALNLFVQIENNTEEEIKIKIGKYCLFFLQ